MYFVFRPSSETDRIRANHILSVGFRIHPDEEPPTGSARTFLTSFTRQFGTSSASSHPPAWVSQLREIEKKN